MKTALIVLEVQDYFLKKAPAEFLGKIVAECQNEYDLKVFTVFRNKPGSNFETSLSWKECSSEEDIRLPEELSPYITDDNVFERTSYSAFSSTELHRYLQKHGIEKVVFCGIDTDACVLANSFGAFDRGYAVDVKLDLTFSTGNLQSEAERILRRNILHQKNN